MRVPILSERDIESRALEVLSEFAQRSDTHIEPPIPIDRIIDEILDIPVVWEPIPAQGQTTVVSKLTQPSPGIPAFISVNESIRNTLFNEFPGLERTALAHEAGHAVFHLDQSGSQQLQLGIGIPTPYASTANAFTDELQEALRRLGPHGDNWWREWQAHTFMRFILMPRSLLLPALGQVDYRGWPGLYAIREEFGVTISALVVHLTKLRIIAVGLDGTISDAPKAKRQQSSLDIK